MSDYTLYTIPKAAETGPWSPTHTYRVLTEDKYSCYDPRPELRRIGQRLCVVKSEWEDWLRRLAEEGLKQPPKETKLSRARHEARLEREGLA